MPGASLVLLAGKKFGETAAMFEGECLAENLLKRNALPLTTAL
ncbi:hypothetical protein THTE_4482 [Thermogutta terrifontis]|uniref:Uncharacterized protein n=1 Tax=Thermogutta terrifontis TaxID=1331910 RepID=A0A286RM82_9BACT|nr:hypothetical protein THTE_4482 [Thermogutta terrifontis]